MATFNWLDKRTLSSEPQPEMALKIYTSQLTCMQTYSQTHRRTVWAGIADDLCMVRGVTHSITGKMRRKDRVCWHRYGVLSDAGAHTCSLTGQSLLKAWIKLWSRCRVNMKAFTAVKKSRLWLELDVWECFLMPAFADDGPFFKSSRAVAGSLPSKICRIDIFTSTCSRWFFFSFFFCSNFLKGQSQACCLATF